MFLQGYAPICLGLEDFYIRRLYLRIQVTIIKLHIVYYYLFIRFRVFCIAETRICVGCVIRLDGIELEMTREGVGVPLIVEKMVETRLRWF